MGFTHDSGLFIDESSISSISSSTTASQADADFTAYNLDLGGAEDVAIQVEATGDNASASGAVKFRFVVAVDESGTFDTAHFKEISVSLDGANTVRATEVVPINGVSEIRLEEIENGDGTYSLSNPTARYGYLY